jgi:hypothetical protein
MKFEHSIIRRRADQPGIAQGEQVKVELDPAQVERMLRAGEALLREANTLAKLVARGQRRGRRKRS